MPKNNSSNLISISIYQIKEGQCPIDFKEDKVAHIEDYAEYVTYIFAKKPVIKGRKVKEFLTGVEFDSVYMGPSLTTCYYKCKKGLIHTAANTSYLYLFDIEDDDVKLYIEQHKDIEAYREKLEGIKKNGYEKAKASLLASYEQLIEDDNIVNLNKDFVKKVKRIVNFNNQENN